MEQKNIRNFAIIAHVDHGKSTLSDRLLELTGTIEKRLMREQLLDSNPIERERGVTIKLAPVTMEYRAKGQHSLSSDVYQLNLIDTPGHVDFGYEVERSLAACEGALLLIDATQGIQAQTLAHAQKAAQLGITLIPVINKIDLVTAERASVLKELADMFGYQEKDVSFISAKTGAGVDELLRRIIRDIPAPSGHADSTLRALVFNSTFDQHLGVIAFIRIVDGQLTARNPLSFISSNMVITPKEVGYFAPGRTPIAALATGQVGYIATGLKDIHRIRIGDTVTSLSPKPCSLPPSPLPGYRRPQPTVYADVYPAGDVAYTQFVEAVGRLTLSDSSLTSAPIHSPVLGPGLRLGFLGLFHIEITKERLAREHDMETIFTLPTVEYSVTLTSGIIKVVRNPNEFPDPSEISCIYEPIARVSLFAPETALGSLMQALEHRRGTYLNTSYLGSRIQLLYNVPLAELVSGLFDDIKSASHGFATMDYELIKPHPVDAVKLAILLNHEPIESLCRIVVKSQARSIGIQMVTKLKELLPPQQFAVPIQAMVGGDVVARETRSALRKDVIAKLYGGDQTRKDKLLKKQKKGKAKMKEFGRVNIPDDVLTKMAILTR